MSSYTNTKVLIVLAGVVVILLVLLLFSSLQSLFGGDESTPTLADATEQSERMAPDTVVLEEEQPVSGATTTAPARNQTDSREAELEAIVDTFTNQDPSAYGGSQTVNTNEGTNSSGSEYSIEDLEAIGLELGQEPESTNQQSAPPPPPVSEPEPYQPPESPDTDSTTDTVASPPEIERLQRTRFDDCGAVDVPSGALSQSYLFSNLDQEASVVCLGRAVPDNCEPSEVTVTSPDDGDGVVYVVKDNDDVCSLGFQESGVELVTLCGLEAILETTNPNQEWEEWEAAFQAEPGRLMADVILQNADFLFDATIVDDPSCTQYQL